MMSINSDSTLFVLHLLTMISHVTSSSSSHSACRYDRHDGVFNCSGAGLTTVPRRGIPDNVTVLDLSANRIRVLKTTDFARATNLRRVDLRRNKIETIAGATFAEQHHLRDIDVSHNNLVDMTTVVGLENDQVARLDANSNRLTTIAWKRLPLTLVYLDISNNPSLRWKRADAVNLPQLRTFNARNTSLTGRAFPRGFFRRLSRLRTLDLSENGISDLSFVVDGDVGGLEQLRVLNLDANPLPCTCDILPFIDWYRSHPNLDRARSKIPVCVTQGYEINEITAELLNCTTGLRPTESTRPRAPGIIATALYRPTSSSGLRALGMIAPAPFRSPRPNEPQALGMIAPAPLRRPRPTESYKSKYTLIYDPMMGVYTASALSAMLLLFLLCLLYYKIKRRLCAEWKKWREIIRAKSKVTTDVGKDRVFNRFNAGGSFDDAISFKQAPLAKGETYSSLASYRSWRPPLVATDTVSSGGSSWRPPYTRAETYSSGGGSSWRPPLTKDVKSLESAGGRSLAKSETLTSTESTTCRPSTDCGRPPMRKTCSVCKQPITAENRTISVSLGSLSRTPFRRGETISLGSLGTETQQQQQQHRPRLPKQYSLGAVTSDRPIIGAFLAKSPLESRPADGYTLGICNQQSFAKSDNGMYTAASATATTTDRRRFRRGSTSPLVLCKQKALVDSESSSIESPSKYQPPLAYNKTSDPLSLNRGDNPFGAPFEYRSFNKSDSISQTGGGTVVGAQTDEQYLKIGEKPCLKYKRLSFTKSDSVSGVPSRKPAIISSGLFKQQLFVRADSLPLKSCRKRSTLKPDLPVGHQQVAPPPSIMKTPSKQQSLTDSLGLEFGTLLSVKQGPVQLSVSWDERTFLKNGIDSSPCQQQQQQQPLLERRKPKLQSRTQQSSSTNSSLDSTRQPLLRPQITLNDWSSGSLDEWTVPRSLQPSPVTTMVTTPTNDVSETRV